MVLVLLRTVLLPVSVMAGAEAWFVKVWAPFQVGALCEGSQDSAARLRSRPRR